MANLAEALRLLKTEMSRIGREVTALRATRVLPKRGLTGPAGADGTTPTDEQILALIPEPIPGRDGDPGHDGKPGTPGTIGPAGPSGSPGAVGALGQPGTQGPTGLAGAGGQSGATGPTGPAGKNGASITDVKFDGDKLAVWIDGAKRIVGTIKLPQIIASGGGGGFRRKPGEFSKENFDVDGEIASTTTLVISRGDNTLLMPPGHAGILEIASVTGEVTLDGGANTIQNSDTVAESANRRFNLDRGIWVEL